MINYLEEVPIASLHILKGVCVFLPSSLNGDWVSHKVGEGPGGTSGAHTFTIAPE